MCASGYTGKNGVHPASGTVGGHGGGEVVQTCGHCAVLCDAQADCKAYHCLADEKKCYLSDQVTDATEQTGDTDKTYCVKGIHFTWLANGQCALEVGDCTDTNVQVGTDLYHVANVAPSHSAGSWSMKEGRCGALVLTKGGEVKWALTSSGAMWVADLQGYAMTAEVWNVESEVAAIRNKVAQYKVVDLVLATVCDVFL